jgi:hypothetical protein
VLNIAPIICLILHFKRPVLEVFSVFSRFATVMWWLGLLAIALGTAGYFTAASTRQYCPTIRTIIQLRSEVAPARGDDQRFREDQMPGKAHRVSRATEELRLYAPVCEYTFPSWVVLVSGWGIGLILWSLPFILARLFSVPPNWHM